MAEENKYSPFTEAEFNEMREELSQIRLHLPEHLMGKMWSRCTRARGTRENQPCSCKSSAGLWARCIEELRKFVSDRI
jgi:hypothetical protein